MEYDHGIKSTEGHEILERVRKACQGLSEVEEAPDGFGYITFRVNGRSFIRIGETETGLALSFKSDHENQEILLQGNRYVKPPYIGRHGWVSVRWDQPVDWDELSELCEEAYLRVAPKRLVKKYSSMLNEHA